MNEIIALECYFYFILFHGKNFMNETIFLVYSTKIQASLNESSTTIFMLIFACSRIKIYNQQLLKSLNCQSQQLSSALSSTCNFKSHFCKQCGPRSDCSLRSSLIRVHTLCLYAKNRFEKFARIFSRRQKQTTFSDAGFLGALRVKDYFEK